METLQGQGCWLCVIMSSLCLQNFTGQEGKNSPTVNVAARRVEMSGAHHISEKAEQQHWQRTFDMYWRRTIIRATESVNGSRTQSRTAESSTKSDCTMLAGLRRQRRLQLH